MFRFFFLENKIKALIFAMHRSNWTEIPVLIHTHEENYLRLKLCWEEVLIFSSALISNLKSGKVQSVLLMPPTASAVKMGACLIFLLLTASPFVCDKLELWLSLQSESVSFLKTGLNEAQKKEKRKMRNYRTKVK